MTPWVARWGCSKPMCDRIEECTDETTVFPGQLNHGGAERLGPPRKQMGQPLKTRL